MVGNDGKRIEFLYAVVDVGARNVRINVVADEKINISAV